MKEVFEALDSERKGGLTVYDLERLIFPHSSPSSLISDIELLINVYDRSNLRRICYIDFQNELIPRLQ